MRAWSKGLIWSGHPRRFLSRGSKLTPEGWVGNTKVRREGKSILDGRGSKCKGTVAKSPWQFQGKARTQRG